MIAVAYIEETRLGTAPKHLLFLGPRMFFGPFLPLTTTYSSNFSWGVAYSIGCFFKSPKLYSHFKEKEGGEICPTKIRSVIKPS